MGFKPFKRQQIAIDKMVNFVNSKTSKKGIFVYPVAFGKSIIIANVAQKFPDKYFINICPNMELTSQNAEKYCSYGFKASICSASLGRRELSQVVFGTIGTLKKYADYFKDKDVVILCDECFTYKTPIVLKGNTVEKIGNIVEKYKKGEEFIVKSFNEKLRVFEDKKVTNVFEQGKKRVYKTYFYNDLFIESTLNHRLLTLNGWKKIQDLSDGDAIVSSYKQNHNSSYLNLNKDQTALVVGSSLGDGSLDKRFFKGHTTRIRMIQGKPQESYLRWKASMFYKDKQVEEIKNNGYSKKIAYRFTSNSFFFKEEFKTYEWQINNLCPKSLAILWMDDGNKDKNSNSGRLYGMADSKKYSTLLCNKLNDMNYNVKQREFISSSTNKKYYGIIFNKESFKKLSQDIAPYVREEFKYKIHTNFIDKIGSYKWDNSEGITVKIFKKTEYKGEESTYDIEVEDNNNFIVAPISSYKTRKKDSKYKKKVTIAGIVAHNCQNSALKGSQLHKFITKLKKVKTIGTTGTPVRLDSAGFGGSELKMMNRMRKCFYSSIEDVVQISEVIENKRWSPLVYEVENVDESYLKLNTTGTDYTLQSLKLYSEKNDLVSKCKLAVEKLVKEGRKSILVYMPFIEDAIKLESVLNNAIAVHSKVPKVVRERAVESFKKGDLQVLVNCLIYVEGFDYPELSAIVQARPTNSITQWYQSLGRLTRIHPNKKDGKIIDLSGNFNKFGKIEELVYEDIPNYGWAMLNGKGELLTGYALNAPIRPTKKSIEENHNKKIQKEIKLQKEIEHDKNPEIKYGMWAGRRVFDIARSDSEKERERFFGWCNWFIKKQKEPSPYPKNFTLIRAIEEYLQQKANDFGKKEKFEVRIIGKIF